MLICVYHEESRVSVSESCTDSGMAMAFLDSTLVFAITIVAFYINNHVLSTWCVSGFEFCLLHGTGDILGVTNPEIRVIVSESQKTAKVIFFSALHTDLE